MQSIHDFKQVRIEDITGILPADRTGDRYSDYLLSSVLERLGYGKPLIFIRDDKKTYESLDTTIRFLVADVYLRINDEQKKKFNTDKNELYCAIPARYAGSDDDWYRANYVYVDDIAIRFGLNEDGQLYTVTFTHYMIEGKDYKLKGRRLDWDINNDNEFWYLKRHGF